MSPLRNVRLLALYNFFCDFRFYGPVLIIYFAQVSGSYVLGASVLSITMLSSALFEVPTGVLSDRLQRRHVALASAVCSTAAVATYAVAPDYWILLVGAVLEGLARALGSGNNDALLYDSLRQEGKEGEYHRHAGRVGSMFQLALAISALLGGAIVAVWSLQVAVALSIVPQALCALTALRFVEPTSHVAANGNTFRHVRQAFSNIHHNRLLRRLVLANSLQHGAGEAAFEFQPAFVNTLWPTWALGIVRTGNNGLAFASFWLSGRVIDRFGAGKTLFVSKVWSSAVDLVAIVKPTVVSPALIASGSATFGTATVATGTILQQEFSDKERSTMGSLGSLFGSIVFAVLAIAAGFVADQWGVQVALIALQAISIATLPVYWSVHRHKRRDG